MSLHSILHRKNRALLVGLVFLLGPLCAWGAEFVIVSDTHVGAKDSLYPSLIKRMEEENVHLIFHTGDAINRPGDSQQWIRFFELTGRGKTVHLAPGNHDIDGKKSLHVYLRFFPEAYHSFANGDALFVFLNTELPGQEHRVAEEQFAWLTRELGRPFRHKFIFLHEPLFPFVPRHGLDRYPAPRDALHGLFVRKQVSLVVAGHDHIYNFNVKDRIPYVIMPPVRARQRFPAPDAEPAYIAARREGERFLFIVRRIPGNIQHEFSIGH